MANAFATGKNNAVGINNYIDRRNGNSKYINKQTQKHKGIKGSVKNVTH